MRRRPGRPATGRTETLWVRVDPETLARLDNARGGSSRSQWVYQLLQRTKSAHENA